MEGNTGQQADGVDLRGPVSTERKGLGLQREACTDVVRSYWAEVSPPTGYAQDTPAAPCLNPPPPEAPALCCQPLRVKGPNLPWRAPAFYPSTTSFFQKPSFGDYACRPLPNRKRKPCASSKINCYYELQMEIRSSNNYDHGFFEPFVEKDILGIFKFLNCHGLRFL